MTTLTISPAQYALLEQALAAREQAARHATVVLASMTAGLVPDGAELCEMDTLTHVLTFAAPATVPPPSAE